MKTAEYGRAIIQSELKKVSLSMQRAFRRVGTLTLGGYPRRTDVLNSRIGYLACLAKRTSLTRSTTDVIASCGCQCLFVNATISCSVVEAIAKKDPTRSSKLPTYSACLRQWVCRDSLSCYFLVVLLHLK